MARSVIAMVACLFLIVAHPCAAQEGTSTAKSQGSDETHAPTRFDIDAQPLAKALRAFSEATGIAVLFDDDLVASLSTQGVHGVVDPRDALRILLVDTGLEAHFASMNAFTVTARPTSRQDVESAPPPAAGDASHAAIDERRAAAIQHAIERALCADERTRPGTYRLAMQVWIDDGGIVSRVSALGSSGDDARDRRVVEALDGLHVPSMTSRFSPVTVLLTPSSSVTGACGEEA